MLTLAFPLLLVWAYPAISLELFKLREPSYAVPLRLGGPLQVREDPYGSGLFGSRRNGGRRHRGVDWVAPVGTPVLAAKSGRAFLGRLRNGMGRYVEVRHPDGSVTRYGHLKTVAIRDGGRIRRGEVVGAVGKSGNARRRLIQPHLHFEIWNKEGEAVDPLTVMEPAQNERHP
ncbi:MAG: M23 family metallopeptidase [Candidatus Omnitrophica bacterium]|nr:M23 family metallopeptidase [Candidatus Omnitrophota bacterium]